MEISVETFDRICRACLCASSNMKSLFTKLEDNDQSLLDLFSLATNLSPRMVDGFPKQVCCDCEVILYKAEEFRNMCLHSESVLKKVFESSTHTVHNFDTVPTESYTNDVKNNLILDKLCDFELPVADKKDLVDFSESFNPEDNHKHEISLQQPVKNEIYENNQDFENDFDSNEPLQMLPMEFKEETLTVPKQPYKSIDSQYKKLLRKTKIQRKSPKNEESVVFACKDCKLNFEDLKTWQSHLGSHSLNKEAETSFQCSLCFRRCKTKKTLSKHMKLHAQTDNIKYSCDKCKREFKYKSFLENHVISVHMHNDFSCHLCTDKFKSKESLEAHIGTHKERKKHVCNICNKAFLMLCTLKDHLRKHTGEKPFLCCTCGKGFSQKTNLAQHTRRHLGVKPFKCDICLKGFVSKGELDAHNRKHSGAHPFVCDDCGNGFTTSSALVKHRRTHTGERPYACDLCPMRFAASGTLKNHRRTHTGERPFQCSLCEKAFVQRTDLVSHIRCHTGERPYICSQCGQAFRKAAALKTHLKMHGKELGIMGVNVVLNGMQDGQLNS